MLVAHAEACSLVNKFVIRLLEARRYILDQDSTSVQHCGRGSVLTPCTSAVKRQSKQTMLSVHSGHFLVTRLKAMRLTNQVCCCADESCALLHSLERYINKPRPRSVALRLSGLLP